MTHLPLWPTDGIEYIQAMVEAAEEYQRWVQSRKRRGITVYSRKEIDNAS